MQPRAFTLQVPQDDLDDLATRLARTRWPPSAPAGWAGGVDPGWLRDVVRHWRTEFDWRAREREINRHPQFLVDLDGVTVHFLHVRGRGPAPLPLVLSHGWPSSFLEFLPVLPLLTDPGAHGGDPADAFDVVVPSLPGFGLTSGPPGRAVVRETPQLWARLMTDVLGHPRFGAHGTDIGAFVTNRLALDFPGQVIGAHVTALAEPALEPESVLTAAEQAFLRDRATANEADQAYAHVQRRTPVTVGYGLHDSPVGLAAWILEKWRAWSDCGGDVERRFSRDELLTTVALYWFTGTALSSVHAYADLALATASVPGQLYPDAPPGGDGPPLPAGRRIDVPAGLLCQVGYDPPTSWARRAYTDLRHRTQAARGGHFMGMEEPQLLAADLRSFFRPLRGSGE
jgi:pimeloyl-ACP methyl ester carboxylesterase